MSQAQDGRPVIPKKRHPMKAGTFAIDVGTLDALCAVRTRLNEPESLHVGEKFDLGRKLDAVIFAIEQGRLDEPAPEPEPPPEPPPSLPLEDNEA